VPLADAAALPSAGLSATQILFELGGLTAGGRVLINGAGGAVGGLAVQLAKRAGATVLATASERSASTVRSFGADEVIDYTVTPLAEAVTEPVDLLVNLVAGPPAEISRLTALVKPGGRAISAPPIPLADDEERDVRWIPFFARGDAAQLTDLAAAVDRGDLRLDVSARYPFTDIAEVQSAGQAGHFRGKVILTVDQ
jgi:NADPH:quinone reductase-like Zn-dependent oxidoreductase